MQDIAKIEPKELTSTDVQKYICPEATEKEIFMFLQIAKSCNLNPFLNQIYLIKYGSQKAQILTSYNVYLQRAERSNKYAGLETATEGSIKDGNLKAVVRVYRKDWEKPLIHEVYYEEYVAKKKDGTVTKFWREKPRTMICKVAISQAMRLAFPLDFEGMPYTSDEINTVDQEKLKPSSSVGQDEPEVTEAEDAEIVQEQTDDVSTKDNKVVNEGEGETLSQKCKRLAINKFKNIDEYKAWRIENGLVEDLKNAKEHELATLYFKLK